MNIRPTWRPKTWVILVLGVMVVSALVLYGVAMYSMRTYKLPPITMTPEDKARVDALQKSIDAAADALRKGEAGWIRVDHSTVGFPEKEGQLVGARDAIETYFRMFHRLPHQLSDLLKIRTATLREKLAVAKIAWACELFPLTTESYILNCDGWKAPQKAKLEEMVRGFDRETERFYLLESHVILYVPPFVKGRAPAIGQPGAEAQHTPR